MSHYRYILHLIFFLLIFRNIEISIACATCVELWQQCGQHWRTQHADTTKNTFSCHWLEQRSLHCGTQHINKQSRKTHRISTQHQQGKTARMKRERMKWVLRHRVQECTYAGAKVECTYACMQVCIKYKCPKNKGKLGCLGVELTIFCSLPSAHSNTRKIRC